MTATRTLCPDQVALGRRGRLRGSAATFRVVGIDRDEDGRPIRVTLHNERTPGDSPVVRPDQIEWICDA